MADNKKRGGCKTGGRGDGEPSGVPLGECGEECPKEGCSGKCDKSPEHDGKHHCNSCGNPFED